MDRKILVGPPEINSSCGHYKDPLALQKFDDVI